MTSLTNEQTVSVGLFEHARDSRDVLDGEAEENEIHRRLAHHVVLVQRLLYRLQKNVGPTM